MFSLELAHRHAIFNIIKKITPDFPKSAAMEFFFQGTQERVRNSGDKRAIGVRAIEVLLYHIYQYISVEYVRHVHLFTTRLNL